MGYCRFLHDLLGEGRAIVPAPGLISDEELAAGDIILSEYESTWRRDLPEPVPELHLATARWGAVWLYHACQFSVYRDVDEEAIQEVLGGHFSGELTADVVYSVDLTNRFLPDVEKFSRSVAERDPLVTHLKERARQWPLSSVGMPGIGDVTVDGFADHPGLMQLYADRIISSGDVSRLADERVRKQIESNLGMFSELAPSFASALSASPKVEPQDE